MQKITAQTVITLPAAKALTKLLEKDEEVREFDEENLHRDKTPQKIMIEHLAAIVLPVGTMEGRNQPKVISQRTVMLYWQCGPPQHHSAGHPSSRSSPSTKPSVSTWVCLDLTWYVQQEMLVISSGSSSGCFRSTVSINVMTA